MVFALKAARTHKRISLMMVISLLVVSTLSIFLVQLYPVSAQSPVAYLTGTIYDRGVDTDGDGTFNFLEVGVEVNVTDAGTFQVTVAGLYDASNNFISVVDQKSTFLDVGIQVVDLSLEDASIYVSGLNPAYVASITLSDDNDTSLDTLQYLFLSREYSYSEFDLEIEIAADEIEREIILDEGGSILVTNAYSITNIGDNVTTVEVGLPEDAYDITLRDEMGTLETARVNEILTVDLREMLYTNETETLYLNYHLPWEKYITQQNGLDYNLHFTFYEQFTWTISKLTVSITLPNGAEFQSSSPLDPHSISQETITFAFADVTPSEDLSFGIDYRYLVFWSSFYPTIWVGVLVVIASAFAFLWKAPKPTAAPLVPVPPKDIRRFVDAYEEKTRIRSELESMEGRLRKGKIPRRRFKVRKKMLDGRLSTVSRDLSSLREKIRAAGPKYANMMRQIEVAETNLEGAERDIQRVKARYRRSEVSKGAYGKLLEEYKRRSEEAEATIDGVILRLREEIR